MSKTILLCYKGDTISFTFNIVKNGDSYKINILDTPVPFTTYGAHSAHYLSDGLGYKICWSNDIKNFKDANAIMFQWARNFRDNCMKPSNPSNYKKVTLPKSNNRQSNNLNKRNTNSTNNHANTNRSNSNRSNANSSNNRSNTNRTNNHANTNRSNSNRSNTNRTNNHANTNRSNNGHSNTNRTNNRSNINRSNSNQVTKVSNVKPTKKRESLIDKIKRLIGGF